MPAADRRLTGLTGSLLASDLDRTTLDKRKRGLPAMTMGRGGAGPSAAAHRRRGVLWPQGATRDD